MITNVHVCIRSQLKRTIMYIGTEYTCTRILYMYSVLSQYYINLCEYITCIIIPKKERPKTKVSTCRFNKLHYHCSIDASPVPNKNTISIMHFSTDRMCAHRTYIIITQEVPMYMYMYSRTLVMLAKTTSKGIFTFCESRRTVWKTNMFQWDMSETWVRHEWDMSETWVRHEWDNFANQQTLVHKMSICKFRIDVHIHSVGTSDSFY